MSDSPAHFHARTIIEAAFNYNIYSLNYLENILDKHNIPGDSIITVSLENIDVIAAEVQEQWDKII